MIPNKFVEKYGEGLPNTLFLKPPNGAAEWKLSLEKRDGKVWFQKGWKEFAEHHSLVHGHLLLFRYQKTSHFQVHIFDSSALEIDYPLEKVDGKMTSKDPGNKPLNGENMKYYRPGQKRKDNSSLEFLQPRMGSYKCVKVDNTMKLPKVAPHHTDRKCKGRPMTIAKQVTAFDRASCFRPCNHPSWLSSIHHTSVLEVPWRSYNRELDTFRHYFLVRANFVLALLLHEKFTVQEYLAF
ncbi:B3 domain-containing protein [Spatholobus suberectus]|nr:B3 domain-containing protein [Spatholobus suberectus]